MVFCGPMGCCFSGVIAFIGIAAPLIFFADVFKLPRMASAVVLGIVVILEVLSLGGHGGLPGSLLGGSFWGEGAWHSARLVLGFFGASVPMLF